MAYRLVRLAPGSYDVVQDGKVIAGLVRNGSTSNAPWTAELLQDVPPHERPAPFTELEHSFGSLEEARLWLAADELMVTHEGSE